MKSRSSTGVGQKIDLEYNIETMRITDPGLDSADAGATPASSIMEQIKSKSTVGTTAPWERATARPGVDPLDPAPKIAAGVENNKLKQMLAGLKSTAK
jgi:hypothetical protein